MRIIVDNAHTAGYHCFVARLNIYVPDEVKDLAEKWRGRLNLSQVCAEALRRELEALEFHRNLGRILSPLKKADPIERHLRKAYSLAEAYTIGDQDGADDVRESLGEFGAKYLDYYLSDDCGLWLGGGRQMWCVAKNLTARQLAVSIFATGIGQNDPRVLHAHPNTIATILWLLFSPRATAQIIGKAEVEDWRIEETIADRVRYFVVGSCAAFDAQGPLARLLGEEATESLLQKGATGDFLYNFFDRKGNLISLPDSGRKKIMPADTLRKLSKREDSRVVLIAGGLEKRDVIKLVLKAQLCSVLITDSETAKWLIRRDR